MWKVRPSAFQDLLYATTLSVKALLTFYQQDNERGQQEGVVVPKRQSKQLRTCQWNVHYFYPYKYDCYTSPNQLAMAIAQELIETEADIIVLNEFGESGLAGQPANYVAQCLEDEGYTIHCAECTFPTAIATKLPVKQELAFALDQERAAVALQVKGLTTTTRKYQCQSAPLWIYATHLEASDDDSGRYRRAEMKRLLQEMETKTKNKLDENVLVIGDFNQQREQDYSSKEWEMICANKHFRGSPQDDGVALQLQEAGFSCIWDTTDKNCNWDQSKHPPPSTHWSGTVIDYTYYRGPSLVPSGVFVSPSDLSDHRLVVCDWKNIEVHDGQTYQ